MNALDNLNQRVNDLTDLLEKLKDGRLQRIDLDELTVLEQLVRSQRNMLAKRARFYLESQRRRDLLRVANGPDGEGRDRAMARLGLTPRTDEQVIEDLQTILPDLRPQ
jgi:hypothetical protein